MMKEIILTLCLLSGSIFAKTEHNILPYDTSFALFQSIEDDAIILGSGEKQIFVFIDPLCPFSCKFIKMVSKRKKMLSKYQYHLFLYPIPRLKSDDVIASIYQSSQPLKKLLATMIDKKIEKTSLDSFTQRKMLRIATVAQKMDVYKRPYIFIVK